MGSGGFQVRHDLPLQSGFRRLHGGRLEQGGIIGTHDPALLRQLIGQRPRIRAYGRVTVHQECVCVRVRIAWGESVRDLRVPRIGGC